MADDPSSPTHGPHGTDRSSDASRSKGNNKRTTTTRAPTFPDGATSTESEEKGAEVCPTMRPSKKISGRPRLQVTVEQVRPDPTGFYILDVNSGKRFMMDTSATVSTIPPPKDDHGLSSDNRAALVAANGSPITCYGMRTLEISIMDWNYS
ncbi:uncharacterized protein [Palaemon carinicauda]|uniref:uncharacterized protein n=1 Tax=Palaemon carinicauda TaxID=392227 RepID=UPI0035B6241B